MKIRLIGNGLAIVVMLMIGCSQTNQEKALNVFNVIDSVVTVAKEDLPSLQAAGVFDANEAAIVAGYLTLLGTFNEQYHSCVMSAGSQAKMLLSCANSFTAGLANPVELAQLRILSPKAQHQVQLYVTAAQLAINVAVAVFGGSNAPVPQVASTPTTSAELEGLKRELRDGPIPRPVPNTVGQ